PLYTPDVTHPTILHHFFTIIYLSFNAPATPEIYTLSLHDALPILRSCEQSLKRLRIERIDLYQLHRPDYLMDPDEVAGAFIGIQDRKSTRLNSSHVAISYAVFCLKKKKRTSAHGVGVKRIAPDGVW